MYTVYTQWLKTQSRTHTVTYKQTHKMPTARAERFANEPNSLFKKLHLSKRSQQELASTRLFISFFARVVLLYSSPGIFFSNKIQSKRILEANIPSFVWRLVKEKKDDECMCCVCVFCVHVNKHAYMWPFVDSWCRVNVIMTSRDAICFPLSRVIQPLWAEGFKGLAAKQHRQTVKAFHIYNQSHWHHDRY